jgi:hypothetical protein
MKKIETPLPKWERRACATADPNDFFTDDKADEVPETAGRYCRVCEIQPSCLQWAMTYDEQGVWGNTTEMQRKRLKRGITRVHCPGCGSIEILEDNTGEICLACGLSWRI